MRTLISITMLFNLVLSAFAQPIGGALVQHKTDTQNAQRIGPGVGAYTEDPKKILRAAGEAIKAIKSLTYEADYRGVGAMATRTPVAVGRVSLLRLAPTNPLKAKIAARGVYFPSGSDEGTIFQTTFDGKIVRKLRAKERILMLKSLSENDPKERTLASVTSFFGGGAYHVLMLEYLLDAPFDHQASASVADYEGRTEVGGVLCHVVYVEDHSDPKGRIQRERWLLGVEDNLPRKLEQLAVGDDGRFGAYVLTLAKLRPNVPLRATTFTTRAPRGYVVKPYEPPERPALLAVGDQAPDWKLSDPNGRVHTLSDYHGQIVVMDFWATWCGPCIRAMPGLERLFQKYKDRGVVVFGVNTWEESNPVEFMKRSGYTYALLLNGEDAAAAYRVSSLPTLYVIGTDGVIIHRFSGIDENLETVIENHLKAR